jgi:NADH-quinone oxidoreductase subunit C
MISVDTIRQTVLAKCPDTVQEAAEVSGVPSLVIEAESIVDVCAALKTDAGMKFDYLMSLSAVDWPDRFDVVYHLYSVPLKHHTVLKVKADKTHPIVPSVTSVWRAADWQEREVYDMFGIDFEGHPDLRRILLEPDWEGFPLRKDYGEGENGGVQAEQCG